uniref:Uncharacterized protein n=1 Tax=Oryza meridionalis TaxID=40149 RepID=A0A0E0E9T9_9ORYZ
MVLASDEFGWSFSFTILEEVEEETRHATVGARLDAQKAGQCRRRRGRGGAHPPRLPRHQANAGSLEQMDVDNQIAKLMVELSHN